MGIFHPKGELGGLVSLVCSFEDLSLLPTDDSKASTMDLTHLAVRLLQEGKDQTLLRNIVNQFFSDVLMTKITKIIHVPDMPSLGLPLLLSDLSIRLKIQHDGMIDKPSMAVVCQMGAGKELKEQIKLHVDAGTIQMLAGAWEYLRVSLVASRYNRRRRERLEKKEEKYVDAMDVLPGITSPLACLFPFKVTFSTTETLLILGLGDGEVRIKLLI